MVFRMCYQHMSHLLTHSFAANLRHILTEIKTTPINIPAPKNLCFFHFFLLIPFNFFIYNRCQTTSFPKAVEFFGFAQSTTHKVEIQRLSISSFKSAKEMEEFYQFFFHQFFFVSLCRLFIQLCGTKRIRPVYEFALQKVNKSFLGFLKFIQCN